MLRLTDDFFRPPLRDCEFESEFFFWEFVAGLVAAAAAAAMVPNGLAELPNEEVLPNAELAPLPKEEPLPIDDVLPYGIVATPAAAGVPSPVVPNAEGVVGVAGVAKENVDAGDGVAPKERVEAAGEAKERDPEVAEDTGVPKRAVPAFAVVVPEGLKKEGVEGVVLEREEAAE